MSFPPVWNPTARNFLGLADRWGTPRGTNVSSILSGVLPVTIVERFRDNLEGSLFGTTAETLGNDNEFSAVIFTSVSRSWEIHSANISWDIVAEPEVLPVKNYLEGLHVFNPINPYNPVVNSPAGFFVPGLINNREFTFGGVIGISGTNPLPPAILGATLMDGLARATQDILSSLRGDAPLYMYESVDGLAKQNPLEVVGLKFRGLDRRCQNVIKFDPPLRIQRNGTICFQLKHTVIDTPFFLQVSIIYTEIETVR